VGVVGTSDRILTKIDRARPPGCASRRPSSCAARHAASGIDGLLCLIAAELGRQAPYVRGGTRRRLALSPAVRLGPAGAAIAPATLQPDPQPASFLNLCPIRWQPPPPIFAPTHERRRLKRDGTLRRMARTPPASRLCIFHPPPPAVGPRSASGHPRPNAWPPVAARRLEALLPDAAPASRAARACHQHACGVCARRRPLVAECTILCVSEGPSEKGAPACAALAPRLPARAAPFPRGPAAPAAPAERRASPRAPARLAARQGRAGARASPPAVRAPSTVHLQGWGSPRIPGSGCTQIGGPP
jgi:hypothetical protein